MSYQLKDFDFNLPPALIAQYPLPVRHASKLLAVDVAHESIQHQKFTQLIDWVNPGDVMVFNDTKVIPARLYGHKETGGKIECLIERIIDNNTALAKIRASKAPRIGCQLQFAAGVIATMIGRVEDLFTLQFVGDQTVLEVLSQYGKIPLPPYIKRHAHSFDVERYQTIYARELGSVAAPTAGLHFDDMMLKQLAEKGVDLQYITLQVGSGTYQSLRHDDLQQQQLHREVMLVSTEVCQAITAARQRKNRIIAVGTTVVRCLETAASSGELLPIHGETQLFIQPGFNFKIVDALLTNFHLPKTSLLILVSAFAGYELTMKSYQQAILHDYRFYSYGDAMFIQRTAC